MTLVQRELPLLQLRLHRLDLRVTLRHLLLQVGLQMEELLLHLQQLVLLDPLGLLLGLLQLSLILRLQHVAHDHPSDRPAQQKSRNRYNYQRSRHVN